MRTLAEAKKRIEKLITQINDLRYEYHVRNNPTVTDDVYDSLTKELKMLVREYPQFSALLVEIDRVAGKPLDKFSKVAHRVPMLSLNDVFNKEELADWETRIRKLLPSGRAFSYFAELKLDGLAVSLIYEGGVFVRGATRGDGRVGENITENLKMIHSIPLTLRAPFPEYIEIRGEVVMAKRVWEKLNKKNEKEGKPLFANTRNAAAGSVRQLDPALTKERELDFIAYDIAEIRDDSDRFVLTTHSDEHALLTTLGCMVEQSQRKCRTLSDVAVFIDDFEKKRSSFPYGTDGIVISVDDLALQQSLGIVGKAPRYMAAYKYPPEKATTTILDITINVGRTGVLTPIAKFHPTRVAGSLISKATLHNMDQIKRLGIKIGDTVVIQKAGDVIPEVVEVLTKMRTGKEKAFTMTKTCPVCASRVEKREVGSKSASSAAHYCSNPNCLAKNRRRIQHFVNAFEIYAVGPKILDRLSDEGLISDALDLFTLSKDDLVSLPRFGEKSAENIIASIEAHRKIPLARCIFALGITHVGEETARELALYFGSLEKLMCASLTEIEEVANIGTVVAESVYSYFHSKEGIAYIQKLKENGIIVENQKKTTGGVLSGKLFVITGVLSSMSREKAKQEIQERGGKVAGSVSAKTDYLVAGENPGSKLTEATKHGTKVLDEGAFKALLGYY
ncbi:MAG: NAD-dependent DNA ligase LigA [Candidatus Pacebacteria bacterium]|jgi:DNA ligase (NAD+)|nr:NAD-dependent DNA ligase LigA [Candidatus Paceibacterota bacterium]